MDKIAGVVALLAVLFLVSRGLPGNRWLVIVAATLAVIVLIVLAEQNGYWPKSWRVR